MHPYLPMLSHRADAVPLSVWHVVEPKLDGWRALAVLPSPADGAGRLQSREGNRITAVPYIVAQLTRIAPADTILDGELIDSSLGPVTETRSAGWNRVQHIASNESVIHDPHRDPCGGLIYVVFDVLRHAGRDVRGRPLRDRRDLLERLFAAAGSPDRPGGDLLRDATSGPYVALVAQRAADPRALERYLTAGFEGAMVKHLDSHYLSGQRPTGAWAKVKPQLTDEVRFTGTYPARAGSKYDPASPTAVRVSVDGRTVRGGIGGFTFARGGYAGRCAGMTDELRARFLDPRVAAEHVGRALEVKHHGVTVTGGLRHPQYLRFRDPADAAAVPAAPAPPVTPPPARTLAAFTPGVPSRRNYAAMGARKLLAAVASLRDGSGDAHDRCVLGGGDPAADLQLAEAAAAAQGLPVPA